ncbi:adenylate/guanylate cyclase domain-containing protein [Bradyrhizobium sp. WSM1253]|uniref:adenylate/guanylate cyclase domain-containing protein n=1 Tax=Bradyrhizobium sp. WSM1253 TaxID=319003 RepID=UPI00025D1FF3|nr:adenylate/guanylate cyclase domain-containing protein [Bradyrhizobium sp. WSM1253]EIG58397.1 putative integral membrane protein [Bradyrhizobium sp. WSM1253]
MAQERLGRIERRLAAILAADVAGYSRLMHHDEETTHTKLTVLLAEAVDPTIAEHSGRIVKNTGDGFLAEFPSAVEALRAAMVFQARVRELTAGAPEDRRIAFRVGINIGDVIVEPHDIFGDGVNIAARLESVAAPGGICISSAVYDQVQGKFGDRFADIGEQNLKNIGRPVRAYAVVLDGFGTAALSPGAGSSALSPPRLSIIVLPFANLSDDPGQDYFVDGVTESLTTDLSRISGSFVIGRHTAFAYKGKAIDLKQIGRELNVRYVLKGSMQGAGDRLRVNVQLVDAETSAHLWADRFDKPVADLFDMQDEIVSRLANTLDAQLTEQEARRSERSPQPNSMDLYFRGKALLHKGWTLEGVPQARAIFERAVTLDPKNVDAMVWMAGADLMLGASYLDDATSEHYAVAEATSIRALCLAPNHAYAHLALGCALMCTNRAAQGIAEFERALTLDHNLAEAHAQIGGAKLYMGRGAQTVAHINEALRLSPRDIFGHRWLMIAGFAKLQLNEDAEAICWFRRSIEANRNDVNAHFGLAAALALLGSLDEAKAAAKAIFALVPSFTIRRFRDGACSDNPIYLAKRERVYQGLRLAEVPEG